MTDIPPRISRRLIGAATTLTTVLSRELAARTAGANDVDNSGGVRVRNEPVMPDKTPLRINNGD